ncbi:unnamed protein product [Peniophora sp. CBMAI 1063]|nr:unnamed protein product [Peniophora sp. CBMAI 1063]
MDDYVFLEDVGRAVEDFGREIARNGLASTSATIAPTGMRGRGRGRGRGGAGGVGRGRPNSKRDVLKLQLEARDIEVEMLPPGMHRRTLNQSTWDFKNQTALLTIEFRLHTPADATTEGNSDTMPHALLIHRCPLTATPLALLQAHMIDRTKPPGRGSSRKKSKKGRPMDTDDNSADVLPPWLAPLVLPHPGVPDAFELPTFFIRATHNPYTSVSGAEDRYVMVDGQTPLSRILKGQTFVEFPTLEVCESGAMPERPAGNELEGRPQKRRKIDVKGGRKAIGALVGAYGSDSEGDDQEQEVGQGFDISLGEIGEYVDEEDAESRGDDGDVDGVQDEAEGEAEEDVRTFSDPGTGGEEGGELPGPVDYAALLDIVHQQGVTQSVDVDWGSDAEG